MWVGYLKFDNMAHQGLLREDMSRGEAEVLTLTTATETLSCLSALNKEWNIIHDTNVKRPHGLKLRSLYWNLHYFCCEDDNEVYSNEFYTLYPPNIQLKLLIFKFKVQYMLLAYSNIQN